MDLKEIVIDAKTGQPTDELPAGLTGFISWQRLIKDVLLAAGEISPDEKVVALRSNASGITFVTTKKS